MKTHLSNLILYFQTQLIFLIYFFLWHHVFPLSCCQISVAFESMLFFIYPKVISCKNSLCPLKSLFVFIICHYTILFEALLLGQSIEIALISKKIVKYFISPNLLFWTVWRILYFWSLPPTFSLLLSCLSYCRIHSFIS